METEKHVRAQGLVPYCTIALEWGAMDGRLGKWALGCSLCNSKNSLTHVISRTWYCDPLNQFTNIECSLCRRIRRSEYLIGRHWYLLANWRSFIRWSPHQWVSQCYRSICCALFCVLMTRLSRRPISQRSEHSTNSCPPINFRPAPSHCQVAWRQQEAR
jgi:hypothetical protein